MGITDKTESCLAFAALFLLLNRGPTQETSKKSAA